MKFIGRYWKLFIALALFGFAVFLFADSYQTEKLAYETQVAQLETMNLSLQKKIAENMRYEDIQDELEEESERVKRSREQLYKHFPVEMKEEDQIMYVLYLETIFGTEIVNFDFNTDVPIIPLRDGSTLTGLTLTVNYKTTYDGFKDMVDYLATDSRIASVQYATIEYDAKTDTAIGFVTITLYLIDTTTREYQSPNIAVPDTGKDNIYD
jgi:hypothetical protein